MIFDQTSSYFFNILFSTHVYTIIIRNLTRILLQFHRLHQRSGIWKCIKGDLGFRTSSVVSSYQIGSHLGSNSTCQEFGILKGLGGFRFTYASNFIFSVLWKIRSSYATQTNSLRNDFTYTPGSGIKNRRYFWQTVKDKNKKGIKN